ncbi:MAG: TonB-dependent receptor [Burkholderiales bacterium]|nr:TonB-dependent receptor [Burkholderiales bacterium]
MPLPHTSTLLPVALAVAAAFPLDVAAQSAPAPAQAASAPTAAAQRAQADAERQESQQIVIIGSASGGARRKLTTSTSITTANDEQIKEAAPSSTADLLKIVPGIFAETSGGTAGANIAVRGFPTGGDAPYVTMQLNGVPVYPASTLSFLENSSLFRLDDTIERVEVLRGGSSPILSNGQPGATANFVQKRGKPVSEGSLRYTLGTGNLQRVDAYYGGKLSDEWFIAAGGFYRTSKGVRDTQFPADEGGQVSLNLTRKLDGGDVSVWGRATQDKNTFFTGIPLVSRNNGGTISGYPGIDPLTGALQGNALRLVQLETTPGRQPGVMNVDLADGRGLDTHMLGLDLTKSIGGWTLVDRAGYMAGKAPTKAIFTGGAPGSLADYIAGKVSAANASAPVVGAAGRTALTGSARFLDGSAITDLQQQVISAGIWSVDKDLRAFSNDARLTRDLGAGHQLTLGFYGASYSSRDVWFLGNSMLMTATSHARPINVTLDNGVKVTRNGFDGASFYSLDASYSGKNTAFTLADDWTLNKQLRLDGGVRWERQSVSGSVGQPVSGDLDTNPLTLYNNNASYLTGVYKPIDFSAGKLASTLGGSYLITENFNTFVRVNSGFRFPNFDDLRDGNRAVETVKQFEVGLKMAAANYSLFLTGFYNTFKGQPQQQFLADGTNVVFTLGSKSHGIEFEGAIRPIKEFELALGGNWLAGEYNSGTFNGFQVQRQPKFQARLTPSYRVGGDWGSAKLFATYAYIGKRFGDVQNLQPLPAYKTLDAGIVANIGDFELRLTGTNLTNEIGITEGNARIIGAGTNAQGVFLGRPIFGRAFQVSAAWLF